MGFNSGFKGLNKRLKIYKQRFTPVLKYARYFHVWKVLGQECFDIQKCTNVWKRDTLISLSLSLPLVFPLFHFLRFPLCPQNCYFCRVSFANKVTCRTPSALYLLTLCIRLWNSVLGTDCTVPLIDMTTGDHVIYGKLPHRPPPPHFKQPVAMEIWNYNAKPFINVSWYIQVLWIV